MEVFPLCMQYHNQYVTMYSSIWYIGEYKNHISMHTDMAKSFRLLAFNLSSFEVASSSIKTASMIGIIMAVVAVLEIHMDKNAVGSIKLKISILGDVPTSFITLRAILLCKSTCSTAAAMMRPGTNQKRKGGKREKRLCMY